MIQVTQIPNEVPALMDFAFKAIAERQFEHAIEACLAVLQLNEGAVEAYHCLSHAYKGVGQADLSEVMLARALQFAPNDALLNYNAAVNAHEAGQNNRAMVYYQQVLRSNPDFPDALWNYGELLRMDEQFQMALDCFERLLKQGLTHYTGLWHQMAVCYSAMERHAEAKKMWANALKGEHDILSHWECALYFLSIEDYAQGTQLYNDRFLCDGRNSVFQHSFPYPQWDGIFRPNMTLLVHGEQGFGDEIMFASMFNELLDEAEKHNAQVVIGCKLPLVRLFTQSFPRAIIRSHKVDEEPANLEGLTIDAQWSMGHLMSQYRNDAALFTAHRTSYLTYDEERSAYYQKRLATLSNDDGKKRMKVGLMWASTPAQVSAKFNHRASQQSIPLELFKPFCDLLDDVVFVSLQNNERGFEAALLPQLKLIDFSLEQADFYDTASLVHQLDLVISVDSSVCHLTGGMAFETWIPLVMRPHWWYGRTRKDSLWYDHTRYFRQTKPNDWSSVIEQMHQALKQRIAQWKSEGN